MPVEVMWMQIALGLPSSVPDDSLVALVKRYHEARSDLHFWLSDNFRPDNVLFRIEHLVRDRLHDDASRFSSPPMFVPFMALAKYTFRELRELLLSAMVYFPWFQHVVLGAGDRTIREHVGTSPREIVNRLQSILQFLDAPISRSLDGDPLVRIPASTLTSLQRPKEKVTVLTAVQGKRMLHASLGLADKVVYNGNPLNSSRFMTFLREGNTKGSGLGCYLMCAFIDGVSSWDDPLIAQSQRSFHAIVRKILMESGQLSEDATSVTAELPPEMINRVAFQGTTDQFLKLVDTFNQLGLSYLVVGGPAVWQDRTIMEVIDSI